MAPTKQAVRPRPSNCPRFWDTADIVGLTPVCARTPACLPAGSAPACRVAGHSGGGGSSDGGCGAGTDAAYLHDGQEQVSGSGAHPVAA